MPVVMAAFADRMLLTASFCPGLYGFHGGVTLALSLMKSPEKVCLSFYWAEYGQNKCNGLAFPLFIIPLHRIRFIRVPTITAREIIITVAFSMLLRPSSLNIMTNAAIHGK